MDSKCKICRRAGEKLFLKGDRCFTPKCAVTRKPYPPGIHGTGKKRRGLSEYGMQLKEKQKLRNLYHLRENQFSAYVRNAMKAQKTDAGTKLLESLTLRLDNVVFEAGFAPSRSMARQLVSHGRVRINGRKTNVPSYTTQIGDVISLKDTSWKFEEHKGKTPSWIAIDPNNQTAAITAAPDTANKTSFNIKLIIEYYART